MKKRWDGVEKRKRRKVYLSSLSDTSSLFFILGEHSTSRRSCHFINGNKKKRKKRESSHDFYRPHSWRYLWCSFDSLQLRLGVRGGKDCGRFKHGGCHVANQQNKQAPTRKKVKSHPLHTYSLTIDCMQLSS